MWGILTFFIGMLYGWLSPGRENKARLLINGIVIGFILALVFGILGYLTETPPLGVSDMLGIVVSVVILTVLFILGAWLGDIIEGATMRRRRLA